MSTRLAGKVTFVTGGGSGIGRRTAERFSEAGAHVVVADWREDAATEVAASLTGSLAVHMDVTNTESVTRAIDAAVEHFGGLDTIICNAGVTIVGDVTDLTEEEWDTELTTNLKSVYLCGRAAWPHLAARGGGSILATASIAGLWAIPADAAYCASKAGVIMLIKCMALDGAKQNIRANCVCPGFIETPMIQGYFADQPDPAASRVFAERLHPLGRLGEPDDIAGAFVYLASDDARWVTGAAMTVDGGLTSGIWGG